jgi:hypothetical protein
MIQGARIRSPQFGKVLTQSAHLPASPTETWDEVLLPSYGSLDKLIETKGRLTGRPFHMSVNVALSGHSPIADTWRTSGTCQFQTFRNQCPLCAIFTNGLQRKFRVRPFMEQRQKRPSSDDGCARGGNEGRQMMGGCGIKRCRHAGSPLKDIPRFFMAYSAALSGLTACRPSWTMVGRRGYGFPFGLNQDRARSHHGERCRRGFVDAAPWAISRQVSMST